MEKVFYTSVWDGGNEVITTAEYDPEIRMVSNVVLVEVDDIDILDREFITLPDFSEIEVLNFENFKSKWIDQECDNCDDSEQLKEEIEESLDFKDMFEVISLWSHKPLKERVLNFLVRNESCYLND